MLQAGGNGLESGSCFLKDLRGAFLVFRQLSSRLLTCRLQRLKLVVALLDLR